MAGAVGIRATETATARGKGGVSARLRLRRIALYTALSAGAAITAFPFFWMVMSALKPRAEVIKSPPTVFPSDPRWTNFVDAWHAAPFAQYFFNSFLTAACGAVGVVITSLLAGYAFTRIAFPGRNLLFGLFLATMMIPFEATLIPNFITIRDLHFYNTYFALIVPWLANVVGVFMMRQFYLTLPNELFEAAKIDGCGHVRTLYHVVLPLAKGPIGAVALFNFLARWNDLLWPLLVVGDDKLKPIQLGLSSFINADANDPQLQMAASIFSIAPILILFFFVQRQFIEGIASSGLKG